MSEARRLIELSVPVSQLERLVEVLEEFTDVSWADLSGAMSFRPSEVGGDGPIASNQSIDHDFGPVPGSDLYEALRNWSDQ